MLNDNEDDDLLYKIKSFHKLLNGKAVYGRNAVYHSGFKKGKNSAILLAFVTLNIFRKEPCPKDCNSYSLDKLDKVTKLLPLDFERIRFARKKVYLHWMKICKNLNYLDYHRHTHL